MLVLAQQEVRLLSQDRTGLVVSKQQLSRVDGGEVSGWLPINDFLEEVTCRRCQLLFARGEELTQELPLLSVVVLAHLDGLGVINARDQVPKHEVGELNGLA